MRTLLLLALVAFSGCLTRYTFPTLVERTTQDAVVISDVAIFDGVSAERLEHRDVLISGGRIEAIGEAGSLSAATRIDGAGKTLLPGLIDFHVHLTSSPSAPWKPAQPDPLHAGRALLFAGITGAQDVGGDVEDLEKLGQRADWLGPDFIYAGKMIATRDGYPASMVRDLLAWPLDRLAEGLFATQVSTPEEATRAVEANVAHGAKLIKVAVAQVPLDAPVFSAELLKAITTAAHARGVKVAAHIDTAEHALLAARAGVDLLVHGVHLGVLTDAQAAELKSLGVAVAPTLVVWDRIEQLIENRFQPTALERQSWPADFLAEFTPDETKRHTLSPGLMGFIRQLQSDRAARLENVRVLQRAGVPLLVGADDNGSVGCMAGAAYQEELRQLVEAGVPTVDVLRGATSIAAGLTGLGTGRVEVGAKADLLLVEGNPLEDINATSRVAQVIKSGVLLKRSPVFQETGDHVAKQ